MLKNLLAAAALGLAAPAAPALAEHARPAITLELGIHDVDHRRGYYGGPNINRWQAVRIASRHGVDRVRDVDFRGGVWEVSGVARRGGRIEVTISARTGRVIDIDYGRGRGFDRDRRWDRGGW